MSESFLGVADWRPQLFVRAADVGAALGDELRALRGQRLEAVWVMWDREGDEWWSDGPVILQIGGRQVEVSVFKSNELYVSLDAIDRDAGLFWAEDMELVWRDSPFDELIPFVGQVVERIGCGEYSSTRARWALVSLDVKLAGGHLAVENGGDENAFRYEARASRSDGHRWTWF